MPNKRGLIVQFPYQGLKEALALEQQPPLTSPSLLNVRPQGNIEGRIRGGNRPGHWLAYPQKLTGAGNPDSPVRLLGSVRTAGQASFSQIIEDLFIQNLSLGPWTAAPWTSGLPIFDGNDHAIALGHPVAINFRGAVLNQIEYEPASTYILSLDVVPYFNKYYGAFHIVFRMNDASPDVSQQGLLLSITMGPAIVNEYQLLLQAYTGGSPDNIASASGLDGDEDNAQPGQLRVIVAGTNIKVYWRSILAIDHTLDPAIDAVLTGKRVGFAINTLIEFATVTPPLLPGAAAVNQVDTFRFLYFPMTSDVITNRSWLIASAAGNLWQTDPADPTQMKQITDSSVPTDLTIASDRLIHGVDRTGQFYIADHGDTKASGTSDAINNDEITTTEDLSDVDIQDDVLVITASVPDAGDPNDFNGTFTIVSLAFAAGTWTITIDASVGGTGTVTFEIARGPKIHNPTTEVLQLWIADATIGSRNTNQVPTGCPLITLWRDRLVLAGNPVNQWFMSRSGNPLDWDYGFAGLEDTSRPMSAGTSEAGIIGKPLTALIPASRDYLIMTTLSEIWAMRGDPARGGVFENVSDVIGCLSRGAWTRGPGGEIWFLSRDGIYRMNEAATQIEGISKQRLPRRLVDIDTSFYTVNMAYDVDFQGVHIYATREDGIDQAHFWYDVRTDGFFPVSMLSGDNPTAIHRYEADAVSGSAVIHGAESGFLNRYWENLPTDGGIPFESHVVIGPVVMADKPEMEAKLNKLILTMATDSGQVTWELYTGDDAEEAYDKYSLGNTPEDSGTADEGVNLVERPMRRGYAFVLVLKNANAFFWAAERLYCEIIDAGRLRL